MPPARSPIARLRALPAWRADALLAALLLIEGATEIVVLSKLDSSRLAQALGVLGVMAIALAFRRRFPLAVLAVVFAAQR